jgi:hypothetical protein
MLPLGKASGLGSYAKTQTRNRMDWRNKNGQVA